MDLDDLLRNYFGTCDIGAIPSPALAAGIERMLVDLGLENDRRNRFSLWSLLYMLGAAPALEVAIKDPEDREAARNFMKLAQQAEEGGHGS